MHPSSAVALCVGALLQKKDLRQAKIIIDAKKRVKVSAKRFKYIGGKRHKIREEFVVTIGPYDYEDRQNRASLEWGTMYTKRIPAGR